MGGALTILGAGGAFIGTQDPFEIGASIRVRFTLPEAEGPMVCDALIRTSIPDFGIGIEFVGITAGERDRLLMATWALA